MTLRSRSLRGLVGCTIAAALVCLFAAQAQAQAQTRWTVDPKASLAWWQIDPHLNHLWGTTCPAEPSWRPGEGRSAGWYTEEAMMARASKGFSNVSDTTHVPLYPRRRVRFVCSEALQGQIVTPDTVRWRGARGQVVVQAKLIATGENMRDVYMQEGVFTSSSYPEIKFTLDSLVDVTRRADTLHATGVGTFLFRGVSKPVTADIKAFPEAGGTRVLAKLRIPVKSLMSEFGITKRVLGLGVYMNIWKELFFGVDLLVHREGVGAD